MNTWIDDCWGDYCRWQNINRLNDDDMKFMKEMTYAVGERLMSHLWEHSIIPSRYPVVSLGNRSVYANSHLLRTFDNPVEDLAQSIAKIVVSKPGNVFAPYFILKPASCGGLDPINRTQFMTRLAVWDDPGRRDYNKCGDYLVEGVK